MTIWKYLIEITGMQHLEIPVAAKILCVQMQGGHPYIWAMVNPLLRLVKRRIIIRGTGKPFDEPVGNYIGTVQEREGKFIWHIFDLGEFNE